MMRERQRLEESHRRAEGARRRIGRCAGPARNGRRRGRRGDGRRRGKIHRELAQPRRGIAPAIHAVGRGRWLRHLSRSACGRGRHRKSGLGGNSFAHVHALGGAPRLQDRLSRRKRRRGRGHQIRDHSGEGRECLWLAEDRSGRASPRADFAVRRQCAPPYELCQRHRVSRDRPDHRDRRGRQGRAHRRLSRVRRGRPARQQNRKRGAHHASANRHRRAMPERTLAAPEPRSLLEHAARAALRNRTGKEEGGNRARTSARSAKSAGATRYALM